MNAQNILLCTLGASWAVIPEIYGWLSPERLDLYAHHPDRAQLDALRHSQQLRSPDELWICTTEGDKTRSSLDQLKAWWQLLGAPIPLRVWSAKATDQLANQQECAHLRELTLRVTLLASEYSADGGQLILSLAGGRKTMSADLQEAGSIFGAHAWLHVVGPDPLPTALLKAAPELFVVPLAPELAGAVMPLVAGNGQRSELLDIAGEEVRSSAFGIPLATAEAPQSWAMPYHGTLLHDELARLQRESSRLLGNFLAQVAHAERHENWRSLYRLAPLQISRLRDTQLEPEHAGWLERLPKADLHRHLGGCLSLGEQRQVGVAVWQALSQLERDAALDQVQDLLGQTVWAWTWPDQLAGEQRAAAASALLVHASEAQLQHNLFDVTEPRLAIRSKPRGFPEYERPGELSGSALLTHPAALAPYAQAIVAQACREGLSYLELRGSPHKYRRADPEAFLVELEQALRTAGADTGQLAAGSETPRIAFVWILDRRQRADIGQVVKQAVAAHAALPSFLLGLDLAGDEGTHAPAELSEDFAPAFENCLPITIHAGEGESAQSIWQAAYHLHADRIGHGLTLIENPALQQRMRDRGICLELCPSSNREVVGFRDPQFPSSVALPEYPLRAFMEAGLPVTLCTDNPGISRTTLANEYLTAARMCTGGLSQWECLALIRQGFVHAFLPSEARERLLKSVDQRIFQQMLDVA